MGTAQYQASDAVRDRILLAMSALAAEKGYAAVTIDDLARAARISKRTFYDHFADKERCLLAAFEAAATQVYDAAQRAADADPRAPWRARVNAVLATYLKALAAEPDMTRVFQVEIRAAGREALELHVQINRRYAALLRRIVREGGEARLGQAQAVALLGAVNELVLHAIVEGRTQRLPSLLAAVRPLFDATISG